MLLHSPFLGETWRYHRVRFMAAPATYFVNFIFQRILRVNAQVPWSVHYTSIVLSAEWIKIGQNVDRSFALSGGCYFQGWNGIEIGDDTIFGPGVKIMSANHDLDNMDYLAAAEPVKIGKRCWLGANALILPEVILGNDVVVGAGAVVTHNFPNSVVIGGLPARIISKRNMDGANQRSETQIKAPFGGKSVTRTLP